MAWELCSKENFTSLTQASERSLDDFWSDVVEDMIREYTGMPNLGRQLAVASELHDGDGTHILLVRQPAIISVTSLLVGGVPIPTSEYAVSKYGIKLLYTKFPVGVANVSVSYLSGSRTDVDGNLVIEPRIRMAAVAMIIALWNYRGRGGADSSIKWGTVDPTEGEENPNQKIGLTSHLRTIMKRTLRRERVRVR